MIIPLLLAATPLAPLANCSNSLFADSQSEISPLLKEERRVTDSPTPIKFFIIKSVFINFHLPESAFSHVPVQLQNNAVCEAFYLQSLSRARYIHHGNDTLISILNKFNGDNARGISLSFEHAYREIYGDYPDVVPTDVRALTARLLDQNTIK